MKTVKGQPERGKLEKFQPLFSQNFERAGQYKLDRGGSEVESSPGFLPLEGEPSSDQIRETLLTKGHKERRRGFPPCAMGGAQIVRTESEKAVDCAIHSLLGGGQQVHPSQYGMNGLVPGEHLDVKEGIDDSCMSTTKQDNNALGGLKKQGLIIQERIRLRACFIQKKRPTGVLECGHPRNFTAHLSR